MSAARGRHPRAGIRIIVVAFYFMCWQVYNCELLDWQRRTPPAGCCSALARCGPGIAPAGRPLWRNDRRAAWIGCVDGCRGVWRLRQRGRSGVGLVFGRSSAVWPKTEAALPKKQLTVRPAEPRVDCSAPCVVQRDITAVVITRQPLPRKGEEGLPFAHSVSYTVLCRRRDVRRIDWLTLHGTSQRLAA